MLIKSVSKKVLPRIRVTEPQKAFIDSEAPFPLFLGGFGAGKTEALINRALKLKFKYKTVNIAYYLPTFDLIRLIAWPRFSEKLTKMRVKHSLNKTENFISIPGKGRIIFRSLENPDKIIGYEVGHSFIDELDTLNVEHAEVCWKKILGRNRQKSPGMVNTISVGTTPEGFRFVYNKWGKNPEKAEKKGFVTYQASTYSNIRNLPPKYISDLRENYDDVLFEAYVNGKYVNLTSGMVYRFFDRNLNSSKEEIRRGDLLRGIKGEDLHIGMDFNVDKMAAVVHVYRGNHIHAVKQYFKLKDTPDMIDKILKDFPLDEHTIYVYPDSSGKSRKTNQASTSDIQLLMNAGFKVRVKSRNPAINDRIISVNTMIKNAANQRRYFVNPKLCPDLVDSLEKLAYDKDGEPDKTSDYDHLSDAIGYFVYFAHPVKGSNKVRQLSYGTREQV